ncbi:Putative CENP-V/GFA domain, Mss4-like superfamily protein [Septoria linicola]|uniref:CENP-V/GFA domain, Mss4-like superfamily protein n=1 Tax=Septoria linicola TaxID=215465 RepID=A0A9Q9EGK3_9PEZI|nr:Putative CENP-V/GFA domain, Mss4-like superfamily protein [Septoria linicola]
MSESSATRTGQCLCGAIKYSLSGPSATPIYSTVCHCLNCRRVTGSAFLCASICHKEGFQITEGASHQKVYWDIATDSGTKLKRVSCDICSSKLFAYTALNENIVSVTAGTLDDFDSWKPDTEQWCIHRAGFLEKVKAVEYERTYKCAVRGEVEEKP